MTAYDIATKVSAATKAAEAGVVISIDTNGDLTYRIWAIGTDGRITEHHLDASCTDEARLTSHVLGFIANHRKAHAVKELNDHARDCQRAAERLQYLADLEENPLVREQMTKGAANMLIQRLEWVLAAHKLERQ